MPYWPPPRPEPPDLPDDDGHGDGWPSGSPDVTETDNPVIATLYGPDGDVLIELHERRTVPFGFQRGEPDD